MVTGIFSDYDVENIRTGVRLTHIPTGITVTSTAQRSQSQNRQDAVKKINAILVAQEISNKSKQTNDAWKEHTHIIRGNPIRVYEGINFKRKKVKMKYFYLNDIQCHL